MEGKGRYTSSIKRDGEDERVAEEAVRQGQTRGEVEKDRTAKDRKKQRERGRNKRP